MVYFVQDMRKSLIKIGYSNQVSARLQVLRSQFGILRLLATTPGMEKRERQLHKQFSADRVTGKWFNPSDDLCCFISKLKTTWDYQVLVSVIVGSSKIKFFRNHVPISQFYKIHTMIQDLFL